MLFVSVDLMGGDNSPHAILEAASKVKDVHFIFVGLQECHDLIAKYDIKNFDFIKADFHLKEGEKFSNTELESSSLAIAIQQVKIGKADFVLSAGPSGYYLLLSLRILGMIGSFKRPALAAVIPKLKGYAIMLDLGANIACSSMDLAQFGIMGVSLSRVLLGTENSHVGFLNVGSELGKGPYNIREACSIFKEMMPNISAGFIEGGDVVNGEADVVVADGFTGNCILKFGEGAMKFLKNRFKLAFNESLLLKIFSFFMKNKLRKVFVDPNAYNGAILAGINGCVIKSHGASDVAAFISAIKSGVTIASKKEEFFKLMEADLNHFQGLDKD